MPTKLSHKDEKLLARLHELKSNAPGIYDILPGEEERKSHDYLSSVLGGGHFAKVAEKVEVVPGMIVWDCWEVFDFMIRRFSFNRGKGPPYGWKRWHTSYGMHQQPKPPVTYRKKPSSPERIVRGKRPPAPRENYFHFSAK